MAVLYFLSMLLPIGGNATSPDSIQALRKTHEIESLINKHYLGDIDEQELTDYMYLGLVSGLGDKYSTYYTAEQYQKLKMQQQGNYVGIGIGIAVNAETDQLVITYVTEDSPAAEAGLLEDDVILEIDGQSTEGLTSSEAVQIIQESESDTVSLKIQREEETFSVDLEKTVLSYDSVYWGMLEGDIGYIQITSFIATTPDQFKEAYSDLTNKGMKGLIIDLRSNPGGLVDSASKTVSQILPKGVIVYTEDKNGNRSERTNDSDNEIQIPMVLLVNENSASASEIFAGAVKDYGVGTLIGTTTYGKGIVQDTYTLSDGSALRITVAHYYTPNGNDIHGQGIEPDITVEEDETTDTDEQLDRALEYFEENNQSE